MNRGRKSKRTIGPIAAFFGTLGGVILLGMIVLTIMYAFSNRNNQKTSEASNYSLSEAIPKEEIERLKKEKENRQFLLEESVPDNQEELLDEEVVNTKYGELIKDTEYLASNNIYLKEGSVEGAVTLGFCGDILFDDEYAVMAALKERGGELTKSVTADTLEAMNAVDIMVVNNEFPYTERGKKQEDKKFTFRADLGTVEYLKQMGADVAILANNHIYDYGEQGLLDTLDTLNAADIHPVGAGRNLSEAVRPVYYIVNDIKIAIISATQIERMDYPNTVGATEDRAGVFRCWQNNYIYSVVSEAKENADYVIACIHWGTEKMETPDTWQLEMAPKLVEAGADLIIGDHSHCLQGIYYYGDVPCVYSLGNFWFNGFSMDSELVQVVIGQDGIQSLKILPARQENYGTHLLYDSEKDRVINYLRSLSKNCSIDSEGYVTRN